MIRARPLEEIKREMKIVNDPTALAIAATLNGERVRPVSASSSLAQEQKEQRESKEAIENDKAIAAVIASEMPEQDEDDDSELKPTSITSMTRVKLAHVNVPTWGVEFYAIPGADQLPEVLQYLCLAYADFFPEAKVTYQYPIYSTPTGTFFNRYVSQIQYHLELAANDFLTEGNIDPALALIKLHGKKVLDIPTQGSGRFNTRVVGRTLLQMAGMAGDVNLREKKAKKKKTTVQ